MIKSIAVTIFDLLYGSQWSIEYKVEEIINDENYKKNGNTFFGAN